MPLLRRRGRSSLATDRVGARQPFCVWQRRPGGCPIRCLQSPRLRSRPRRPSPRRRLRRPRRVTTTTVIATTTTAVVPATTTAATDTPVDPAGPPEIDAAAYVVYDVGSQRWIAEREADAARPVGSLMKLLTAFVVMQAGDPTHVATVPPMQLDASESSIGLYEGERLRPRRAAAGDVDRQRQRCGAYAGGRRRW